MRLIDADELKDNCFIYDGDDLVGRREYVTFHEIDEAPTIEPSKSTDQKSADVPSGDLISRADAVKAMRKLLGDDFGKRAEIELNCLTGYVPSAEKKEGEYADEIARRIATIIENEQDMRVILESAEYSKPLQTTLNGDLISREDAIEIIASHDETNGTEKVFTGREITDLLAMLPSDRPKGEWHKEKLRSDLWTCSVCGSPLMTDDIEETNFCPNCGADMRGNNNDKLKEEGE